MTNGNDFAQVDIFLFLFQHLDRMLLAELGPRGKGRLLEVTQLIEQGADVNCKDYKGYTPIYNGKSPGF